MSAWQPYIDNLMADKTCQNATIVGCQTRSVWASTPGPFASISPAEIDMLLTKDRSSLFTNGITLAGQKCSVIRDNLFVETEWTMDIRTKNQSGGPTYNIAVSKSNQTLVIVEAKEGVHGGVINKKVFEMGDYLRKSGY
ncbi:profilin-2-like [Petromyzon marinus]|uniref:Profilin n=1 Tax=Petromyzon marinus TaxID=7757 RepID=A0AAJ7XBC2_PETMA|nr:profilin-2-like [Petromyzon marinus]XP_061426514.1 profilin-2-like [Lethenteron reissneri]XP_061426538.1 LOW QUALITY PROTEIN: profilin-2-like [Lethenteron reissneri]